MPALSPFAGDLAAYALGSGCARLAPRRIRCRERGRRRAAARLSVTGHRATDKGGLRPNFTMATRLRGEMGMVLSSVSDVRIVA